MQHRTGIVIVNNEMFTFYFLQSNVPSKLLNQSLHEQTRASVKRFKCFEIHIGPKNKYVKNPKKQKILIFLEFPNYFYISDSVLYYELNNYIYISNRTKVLINCFRRISKVHGRFLIRN